MAAGQIVRSPQGEDIELVDVGQTVLLDNETVRVWEVALEPGERQPWHLHHNPYVVLCLGASPGRMDWLDGSDSRYVKEYVGGAVLRPVSPVHRLTNIGDNSYRNRLIELKDLGEERPATSTAARAGSDINAESRSMQTVGGDGRELVLESPYLKIWTVSVPSGERSTVDTAAFPYVTVSLDPASDDPTGGVAFHPAGSLVQIVGRSTQEPRTYLVELSYASEAVRRR